MAAELAQEGLSVLALERGGPQDTVPSWAYPKVNDEIKNSARHGLLQNLHKTTVTLRHDRTQRAVPYRRFGSFKPGEGVGGAGAAPEGRDEQQGGEREAAHGGKYKGSRQSPAAKHQRRRRRISIWIYWRLATPGML